MSIPPDVFLLAAFKYSVYAAIAAKSTSHPELHCLHLDIHLKDRAVPGFLVFHYWFISAFEDGEDGGRYEASG